MTDIKYRQAADIVRKRLYEGETGDDVREAVEEVLALAPGGHKHIWRRWLTALEPGHRIKVGVYDATFVPLDDDPEMVAEIEAVFQEEFGRTEGD